MIQNDVLFRLLGVGVVGVMASVNTSPAGWIYDFSTKETPLVEDYTSLIIIPDKLFLSVRRGFHPKDRQEPDFDNKFMETIVSDFGHNGDIFTPENLLHWRYKQSADIVENSTHKYIHIKSKVCRVNIEQYEMVFDEKGFEPL